jgi:uncharacterized protein (DUF305 family)
MCCAWLLPQLWHAGVVLGSPDAAPEFNEDDERRPNEFASVLQFLTGSFAMIVSARSVPLLRTAVAAAALFLNADQAVASAPAPDQQTSKYEIRFLTNMIDHHSMAVMMAELCETRAAQPDLRSLCTSIVSSQSEQIETMQGWLQDWYGVTYEPVMKPGMEKRIDGLSELSGAAFDVEFMEMMIRHHAKAVQEGVMCLDRAYHADLESLCANIVQTQAEEIALMQSWLCSWYQVECHE